MENDRMGYNCVVSQRALREIYLLPFMLAQKHAKPWCYMTAYASNLYPLHAFTNCLFPASYNRVNGTHAGENHHLLQEILRKEWKFDGLVMTDWYDAVDSLLL